MIKSHRAAHDRGNVLFIILLAVVLFAALNSAVTNSTRGEGKNASSEIASMTAADLQQYTSLIENTVLRLTTSGGCTTAQISYESVTIADARLPAAMWTAQRFRNQDH